ncbi:MAG: MoxR family ATPase [Candidatus Bathyarchaeia archaeon]
MERTFVREIAEKLSEAIHEFIVGMDDAIHSLIIALLTEGHVLLEGPPGIAKTYLTKAFAHSLGLGFRRIQFTSDLMPSDITGTTIYNRATGNLEFRRGPVFANIVLADEINRSSPRVQSALLEAMQERQVTVDGTSHQLPSPFMLIATQNPIELEGTYPLPEAELDRFLMRVILDYPESETEMKILEKKTSYGEELNISQVASPADIADAIEATHRVYTDDSILNYIVNLAGATRRHERVSLGVSPRGEVSLLYASKAEAATEGYQYVIPDHVKAVLFPVFNHRIILRGGRLNPLEARGEVKIVLKEVLESVDAPR